MDIRVKLTPFQLEEVERGLSVSACTDELQAFGEIERSGRTAHLVVTDIAGAIYRLTSSRDIFAENALYEIGREGAQLLARARSMQQLTEKVIKAAGGTAALPADAREQVRLWGV